MPAKNPKAYFPGCTARISYKPVDKWARSQAQRHPSLWPYFETWEAAHSHMVRKAMEELERREKALVSARKHLFAVLEMTNPNSQQKGEV